MTSVLAKANLYQSLRAFARNAVDVGGGDAAGEEQYECAWRLGQWEVGFFFQCILHFHPAKHTLVFQDLSSDLDESSSSSSGSGGRFARDHFAALKSIVTTDDDRDQLQPALTGAARAVCAEMGRGSRESTQAVYALLTRLRMLRELELAAELTPEKALAAFREYDAEVPQAGFEFTEPVLAQRFRLLRRGGGCDVTENLCYVRQCRENGLFQLGHLRLASMKADCGGNATTPNHRIQFEEALLLWDSDEKDMGRLYMMDLKAKLKKSTNEYNKSVVRLPQD